MKTLVLLLLSTVATFGASLRDMQYDPTTKSVTPTNLSYLKVTNLETTTVLGTTGKFAGTITGAIAIVTTANVAGAVTGATVTAASGTFASNVTVRAGSSNVFVGGVVAFSTANFVPLNGAPATFTNLASAIIPANALTNAGDRLHATWGGRDAGVLVGTNNFRIVYGSQTILDTGLQVSSNFTFRAWLELTRTGSTAQHAEAHFEWNQNTGVTGLPWTGTNVNLELAQTNGIATTLALQGASQRVGGHTNNFFLLTYTPGSR